MILSWLTYTPYTPLFSSHIWHPSWIRSIYFSSPSKSSSKNIGNISGGVSSVSQLLLWVIYSVVMLQRVAVRTLFSSSGSFSGCLYFRGYSDSGLSKRYSHCAKSSVSSWEYSHWFMERHLSYQILDISWRQDSGYLDHIRRRMHLAYWHYPSPFHSHSPRITGRCACSERDGKCSIDWCILSSSSS